MYFHLLVGHIESALRSRGLDANRLGSWWRTSWGPDGEALEVVVKHSAFDHLLGASIVASCPGLVWADQENPFPLEAVATLLSVLDDRPLPVGAPVWLELICHSVQARRAWTQGVASRSARPFWPEMRQWWGVGVSLIAAALPRLAATLWECWWADVRSRIDAEGQALAQARVQIAESVEWAATVSLSPPAGLSETVEDAWNVLLTWRQEVVSPLVNAAFWKSRRRLLHRFRHVWNAAGKRDATRLLRSADESLAPTSNESRRLIELQRKATDHLLSDIKRLRAQL